MSYDQFINAENNMKQRILTSFFAKISNPISAIRFIPLDHVTNDENWQAWLTVFFAFLQLFAYHNVSVHVLNMCTMFRILLRQIGQFDSACEHSSQATMWLHGRKTVLMSLSIQILHCWLSRMRSISRLISRTVERSKKKDILVIWYFIWY